VTRACLLPEQSTSRQSNRLDWNSARLKERVSGGEDAEEIASETGVIGFRNPYFSHNN